MAGSSFIRGASPLGLPYTRSRAPLRRRAPFAWLASLRSLASSLPHTIHYHDSRDTFYTCGAMSWLVLVLSLLQAPPSPALETRVRKLIEASGAEVAVAMRTLDGRSELLIDPDKTFHAASTMKVPVMIELFRQAEAGTLSLDEALRIRNEFHSIVDGSVYQLDVSDDSDSEVYEAN